MTRKQIERMYEVLGEWTDEEVPPEALRAVIFTMAVDIEFEALILEAVAEDRRSVHEDCDCIGLRGEAHVTPPEDMLCWE